MEWHFAKAQCTINNCHFYQIKYYQIKYCLELLVHPLDAITWGYLSIDPCEVRVCPRDAGVFCASACRQSNSVQLGCHCSQNDLCVGLGACRCMFLNVLKVWGTHLHHMDVKLAAEAVFMQLLHPN